MSKSCVDCRWARSRVFNGFGGRIIFNDKAKATKDQCQRQSRIYKCAASDRPEMQFFVPREDCHLHESIPPVRRPGISGGEVLER